MHASRQTGPSLTLRPTGPGDEDFLRSLFFEAKAEELADAAGGEALDTLVALQYDARARHYAAAYPGAVDQVVELDGQPAGRILVLERDRDLLVVDLGVRAAARGRGVASHAVAHWAALADRRGVPMLLHVSFGNPAAEVYRHLGFTEVGVDQGGLVMRRPAARNDEAALG
ncbi:GNAT family N-acetyltransferase [Nocardioides taihuensis]|uniref:GNAT family N-acetyltransferase n=1 Tax=Nocardioides taihuensis TaxID=1835606 RepID=A0ABW0BPQ4_9ACTN